MRHRRYFGASEVDDMINYISRQMLAGSFRELVSRSMIVSYGIIGGINSHIIQYLHVGLPTGFDIIIDPLC